MEASVFYRMGDISHASDEDELYGELRDTLERFFREYDLLEEGVIVAYHQVDRATNKNICRLIGDWEGDEGPTEFERRIEKVIEKDVIMISIRGWRHDYRIYLEAETVTEALGIVAVFQVMTS